KGNGPRAAPQARPRLSFFASIDDKEPGLMPGFFVCLFKTKKYSFRYLEPFQVGLKHSVG
ncbi:hypothetical protein ACC848_41710, partial [Rhizobium johnstonii]